MNGFRALEDRLRAIRGAVVLHAFAESCVVFGLCALVWVTSLVFLALFVNPPEVLSSVGLAGLAVLFLASLYVRFWRTRKSMGTLNQVALSLETSLKHDRNEIITALEWGNHDAAAIEAQGLSSKLVRQVLLRANELASKASPDAVIERAYLRGMGRLFVILALVVGGSFWWSPTPFVTGASRILYGAAELEPNGEDSGVLDVDVLLKNISVSLVHPAYSRLPVRTIEGSAGDIAALAGTVVTVTGELVHPLQSAVFSLDNGSPVPIQLLANGQVQASWTLLEEDTYHTEGESPSGRTLRERTDRSMDVLPDHPPTMTLRSPEGDLEVNLEDQVKLIYQASDDFGLSQIDLVVQNLGGGDPYKALVQRLDAERLYRGETTFDIRDANPEPGDVLELTLVAYDQDTINGPNQGRSATVRLEIWSPQEKHDELVDAIAELMDDMLNLLADRLENPLETGKKPSWKKGLDATSVTHRQTLTFLDTLERILLDIREDPLMPLEVVDELKSLRVRHQENAVSEGQLLRRITKSIKPMSSEDARLIYVQNEESIEWLEKDILLIEDLVERLRQDKLLDQTRDLMTQQDELMRLLDEMKMDPSDENSARAEAVVDRLQEQLQEMMNNLAKQSQKLPYENFNPGALDPKGTQADVKDFQSELEEIRRMLAEGDIEGAQKAAEALQQRIAEMMASMESGFDGMNMAAASTEAQEQLGKVEAEVAQVSKEEKRILRETNDINENVREAMEAMRQKRLDAFFEEQRERVAQIRKKLSEIREDPIHFRDQERLNQLKDATRDLEDRLSREDLDRSDESAEQIAKECNGLGSSLREQEGRMESRRDAKSLGAGAKSANEAEKLAKEIAKDIRELSPDPRDFLSPDDEKRLSKLEKDQKQNRKRLKKLQKDVQEMDEIAPALEGAFSKLVQEADSSMKKAQEGLGEGKPRVAAQEEENALDKLGRAQKRIQQMMQPGQGPGTRQAGHRDQDTGIPDAEDYTVPADFRNNVMRAMKGNAPPSYKGQIDSYYQELMR